MEKDSHPALKAMMSFVDSDAFLKFKGMASQDMAATPYVITKCPELAAACNERVTKASLGIFRIQYPSSQQAKDTSRGQTPFIGDKKHTIREKMLDLAPATDIVIKKENETSMAARIVNVLSTFACSPGMLYKGLERQGMANCRYQISGERELVVVDCADLSEYAARIWFDICQEQDFVDYMKTIFNTLNSKESLSAFSAAGGSIHRVVLSEGSLVYVPIGAFIMERTLGSNNVIGLRTMHLPKMGSVALNSFAVLKTQAAAVATNPLTTFWDSVSLHIYLGKLVSKSDATAASLSLAKALMSKATLTLPQVYQFQPPRWWWRQWLWRQWRRRSRRM
jgi:hypothetical protein